jgi:hypothetical protein
MQDSKQKLKALKNNNRFFLNSQGKEIKRSARYRKRGSFSGHTIKFSLSEKSFNYYRKKSLLTS